MKKYLIYMLLVLVFTQAFAYSVHAQSYVTDCPDTNSHYDGWTGCKCNDGYFVDSSTGYCKYAEASNPQTLPSITSGVCPVPYASGCTKESDYQQMQTFAGMYGTTNEPYEIKKISDCRQQINDYQSQTTAFNLCISNQTTQNPSNTSSQPNTTIPQITCSANSTKQSNGSCTCDSGYTMTIVGKQYQCITIKEDFENKCKKEFGQNSIISPNKHSDNGLYCSCSAGYAFDKTGGKQCIPVSIPPTTQPVSSSPSIITPLTKPPALKNEIIQPKSTVKKVAVPVPSPSITQPTQSTLAVASNHNYGLTINDQTTNPQPVKKAPWYQRFFNWLFK